MSTKINNSVDKTVDISLQLSRKSRPSILVRAARYGAATALRRNRNVQAGATPPPYHKLMEEEERLNDARCSGDAGYSPTRHVEVLATLLAAAGKEAQALQPVK